MKKLLILILITVALVSCDGSPCDNGVYSATRAAHYIESNPLDLVSYNYHSKGKSSEKVTVVYICVGKKQQVTFYTDENQDSLEMIKAAWKTRYEIRQKFNQQ